MRASCWVSVLPPSTVPANDVAEDGAAERDRIDAGVLEEAVILDRDERVLQVGGNVRERHVLPVLVHAEPPAAVGGEKPRVADAATELVDSPGLAQGPRQRDCGENDERSEDRGRDSIAPLDADGDQREFTSGCRRRRFKTSESTV